MLKGHVFSKQLFEHQIFALFIDTFLNKKCGIIANYKEGMEVTFNGSNITVHSGCACVRGRFLEEDSFTTLAAGTDNMFCSLVIEVDLDKVNTETELNQLSYKILRSADNYPTLTKTDIVANNSGIYQHELARFKASSTGITNFYSIHEYLDFESIYQKIYENNNEEMKVFAGEYRRILKQLQDEFNAVTDGIAYILKKDIAVITINVISNTNNWTSRQSYSINYPEGFNIKNCFVISCMRSSAGAVYFSTGGGVSCSLHEDEISIDPVIDGDICRIVLMKIPTYSDILVGDVNLDGEIDITDANLIKEYINGTVALTSKQLQASDINKDGEVKTTDYMLLKNYVEGLTDSLE